MSTLANLLQEMTTAWTAIQETAGHGHLFLLVMALLIALSFEFINGFHDTANAVAMVIYTRSLKPMTAVTLSGIFNFIGVFVGGTAVAMGIVKLLPIELLVTADTHASLAMIFALLLSAIAWNLGTWFFGIPASSSHTLIGSILGIGLANAWISGASLQNGVNWTKAADIGLALLISPLIGFAMAALLLLLSKVITRHPAFHQTASDKAPPLPVRALLVLTSSGVSLAHGSNDGQKGVGLIVLILIAVAPAQFAVRPGMTGADIQRLADSAQGVELALTTGGVAPSKTGVARAMLASFPVGHAQAAGQAADPVLDSAVVSARRIHAITDGKSGLELVAPSERFELRSQIMKLDSTLGKLEKSGRIAEPALIAAIGKQRAALKGATDYVPSWVLAAVAVALGLGTMVGWKGIVVTIGEKIGKAKITYAQGTVAQLVAMSTIGISAIAGLPVSTTHVLSSGVAGTMVAGRAGIQMRTVKSILLAWVLTLPVTMALSALLFALLLKLTG